MLKQRYSLKIFWYYCPSSGVYYSCWMSLCTCTWILCTYCEGHAARISWYKVQQSRTI